AWEEWKENWESYSGNYENVSLTPGADESQLNYAWYSHKKETPRVRIAARKDMENAAEYKGKQQKAVIIAGIQYYSNKVTVSGLKENTDYYYQVWKNGAWKKAQKFRTRSFQDFSFLFVGDPQIGACKGTVNSEGETMTTAKKRVTSDADENLAARNDSYNWNQVLKNALKEHGDVSFMVSAGDQVNYSKNEREYAGYLGAEALRSLPVATAIGNHERNSDQYSLHFHNPNAFSAEDKAYTKGKSAAGTDYYFTYGSALFIVLDTNNYNCETHENVLKKAVAENGDAKWRIVVCHHDIYGSGKKHSAADGIVLRTQLTPMMDDYDIDVVLQGHDHSYSRTYQLTGDGEEHKAYTKKEDKDRKGFKKQNNCYEIVDETGSETVINPKGTVYIDANSSTGSYYYKLISDRQDYISERSQNYHPSYAVISVTEDSLSVTTYDAMTGKQLKGSSTYTIIKDGTRQVIKGRDHFSRTYGDKPFLLQAKAEGMLSYASSDTGVVKVDEQGLVTIKGVGEAVITAYAAATDTKMAETKKIKITVRPRKQRVNVSNKTKGKLQITWKRDKKVSGYELVYAADKKFKKDAEKLSVKKKNTDSYTLTGLKSGRTYYIKIRAYKKVKGKKLYGAYSKTVKVKVN
nr:metallophosphoesterase [Lachnospiraceae bacterium]